MYMGKTRRGEPYFMCLYCEGTAEDVFPVLVKKEMERNSNLSKEEAKGRVMGLLNFLVEGGASP